MTFVPRPSIKKACHNGHYTSCVNDSGYCSGCRARLRTIKTEEVALRTARVTFLAVEQTLGLDYPAVSEQTTEAAAAIDAVLEE